MICAALLTGGCSDTAPAGGPSADEEPRVEVGFRLEAPDTDTSLEPMTRASSYKEWFGNACRLLILKKTGARWIVDATQTVLLDADSGPWAELKLADALPPCSFGCERGPAITGSLPRSTGSRATGIRSLSPEKWSPTTPTMRCSRRR